MLENATRRRRIGLLSLRSLLRRRRPTLATADVTAGIDLVDAENLGQRRRRSLMLKKPEHAPHLAQDLFALFDGRDDAHSGSDANAHVIA